MWLDGATDVLATLDKRLRYGDAQFLHQLPADRQLAVIRESATRRTA